MNVMKAEIEACIRANMQTALDPDLASFGFHRRKSSLIYTRRLADAVQKIEVAVEIHPRDRPDSAAAVYPWLSVRIEEINKLALEMVGGDESLAGSSDITLRQPIEFTSAKAESARWFVFQQDSVSVLIGEMRSFLQHWTIPFLNLYSTPAGVCHVYDQGDARVINDLPQKVRVVAAMALCGRTNDAQSVMDRWFGKPGSRKRYQQAFDYLAERL